MVIYVTAFCLSEQKLTDYFLQDHAVTDVACAALNGLKMGDKTLTVRRATIRLVLKLSSFY